MFPLNGLFFSAPKQEAADNRENGSGEDVDY